MKNQDGVGHSSSVKETSMQHESLKPKSQSRSRAIAQGALLVLPGLGFVAGCGEALNLGADEAALGVDEETCSVGQEDIVATTQEEIDALRGCRELAGSLTVRLAHDQPGSLSLEPLASLEVVRGQLWIDGPATSLVGLEALEEVGALQLTGLRVPNLLSLQALSRAQGDLTLRVFDGGYGGGLVRIDRCEGLIDLQGLENLTTWSSLSVEQTESLESLAGLRPPRFIDGIQLQYLPRLKNVTALGAVREAEYFVVRGTGIERINPPLGLDRVELLELYENAALTDLDGLIALSAAEVVRIEDNDALVNIELPDLSDFDAISIVGNDALTTVPHYEADQPNPAWPIATPGVGSVRERRALFEVGDNALVTSIILPTDAADLGLVSIYGNQSLASIDMGNLERADTFWILDNPVLESVTMANLRGVDSLQVKGNPALSVAPFATLQTFTRDVTGNLDELAP
jgi:hypothetical protein